MTEYRFGDICKVINGRAYKQPELLDSGKYPVLRVGNFFSSDRWFYSDLELPEDKYCDNDDLLFAWSASFGPRIWDGGKVIYHYHIWKLEPDDAVVDKYYLYYWLRKSVDILTAGTHGSVMAHMTKGDMENQRIMLPNIEVQRQVGKILRLLDDKIKINSKINDNLLQQLRAIFMERFTNNPALESIQQVPLSELCSVVTKGTTPTTLGKPFVDRGINFLKAESILDNHSLDQGKFAHIDEETHDMLKRSVICVGDIVFTIAGTLGRFALIDSDILPANTNQAVAIIRADKGKISPEYLYACFIGNWHNDYYSKRVQQAVQANLSLTTIKSLPIPVLTQDEMVSYMALISPIIKMLKQNEMENERLAALRDTLLPRLMSGEIDVSGIRI